MTQTTLLEVIEKCYAAALSAASWPDALTALADFVGGVDATLEAHRGAGMVPVFFSHGRRLPDDGLDAYLAHYSKVCPRIAYIGSKSAGSVGFDYDFMSEAEMDRDEFYADFLAPYELRYFASASLTNRPGSTVSFAAVHRSPRQGHAEKRQAHRLKTLIPHLRQALDTHLRLGLHVQRESSLLETLDQLDAGVVLLDAAGRVIHANGIAEEIARSADGLTIAGARLAIANAAARQQLDAILAGFLGGALEAPLQSGGEIFVPRPSGRSAYALLVRRLPGPDGLLDLVGIPAAIVFLHDPARETQPTAARIVAALGLTPREAELAAALHAGESLSTHAAARGIRLSTARFHLYQAMAKIGVRRQADMVRLLSRLSPPLH